MVAGVALAILDQDVSLEMEAIASRATRWKEARLPSWAFM